MFSALFIMLYSHLSCTKCKVSCILCCNMPHHASYIIMLQLKMQAKHCGFHGVHPSLNFFGHTSHKACSSMPFTLHPKTPHSTSSVGPLWSMFHTTHFTALIPWTERHSLLVLSDKYWIENSVKAVLHPMFYTDPGKEILDHPLYIQFCTS